MNMVESTILCVSALVDSADFRQSTTACSMASDCTAYPNVLLKVHNVDATKFNALQEFIVEVHPA